MLTVGEIASLVISVITIYLAIKYLNKLDKVALFYIVFAAVQFLWKPENLTGLSQAIIGVILALVAVSIYWFFITAIWNHSEVLYKITTFIISIIISLFLIDIWTSVWRKSILRVLLKDFTKAETIYFGTRETGLVLPADFSNPTVNLIFWISIWLILAAVIFIKRIIHYKSIMWNDTAVLSSKRQAEKDEILNRMAEKEKEREYEEYEANRKKEEEFSKRYEKSQGYYYQDRDSFSNKNQNNRKVDSEKPKDYYAILNVSRNATQEEIKIAYKKEMLKYHPDLNNESSNSTEITKLLNEAYNVLKDPEKRKEYDRFGRTL